MGIHLLVLVAAVDGGDHDDGLATCVKSDWRPLTLLSGCKIRWAASEVYVLLSFKCPVYKDQLHISHPHRSQSFDVGNIPLY